MSTIAALIQSLPQLLNLLSFFISIFQKTPEQKRRDMLSSFDVAISKAQKDNDPTELSLWLGKHL